MSYLLRRDWGTHLRFSDHLPEKPGEDAILDPRVLPARHARLIRALPSNATASTRGCPTAFLGADVGSRVTSATLILVECGRYHEDSTAGASGRARKSRWDGCVLVVP